MYLLPNMAICWYLKFHRACKSLSKVYIEAFEVSELHPFLQALRSPHLQLHQGHSLGSAWRDQWWKKNDGLKTCCKRNFVEQIYVWIGKEILHTKFTHVLYKMFIMIVLTCTFLFSLRVVRWHFIAAKERSQDQSCGKLWNSRTLSKYLFAISACWTKKHILPFGMVPLLQAIRFNIQRV